jgi:hypothetical protein
MKYETFNRILAGDLHVWLTATHKQSLLKCTASSNTKVTEKMRMRGVN